MIMLGVLTAQLVVDGRITPTIGIQTPRGQAAEGLPDIYVILLDAHPRADTLASEFGYNSDAFVQGMEAAGFDVASASRSNYTATALTLTSMFHMQQLPDIAEFTPAISGAATLASFRLRQDGDLDNAPVLNEMHRFGYEVVNLESEWTKLAIPADRYIGTSHINDLEIDLLVETRVRGFAPDLLRDLVTEQHRDRISESMKRLVTFAAEPATGPRFVFAHILAPHHPPVVGPGGKPLSGFSCFPRTCSLWGNGEPDGHETEVDLIRQSVAYLDDLTVKTVRSIIEASVRPPVIVVMSDHGIRNDTDDHDEMLRSLFDSFTPGKTGVFPVDPTPVNLFPRLLNAYAGSKLPFASEESYWLDENPARVRLVQVIPNGGDD
jgi:hypothetical protein